MKRVFDDYREGLDALSFSPAEKNELVERLLAASAPRRRPWVARAAAIAGLALVLGAGAGVARATGAIDAVAAYVASAFWGGQASDDVVGQVGRPLGASAACDGVTVTAEAVYGDRYAFAVVLSVKREDGEDFEGLLDSASPSSRGLCFESMSLEVDGGEKDVVSSGSFSDADPGDNAHEFVILANAGSGEGGVQGSTARVTLGDLYVHGAHPGDPDTPLAEGEWSLEVPLDYEDTTVELSAGQEATVGGVTLTVREATVSPLSASFVCEVGSGGLDLATALPVTVTLVDGTSFEVLNGGSQVSPRPDGGFDVTVGVIFDRILDVSDIASVAIGDVAIEVPRG